MKPFLDCNIWSVLPAKIHLGYFLIEKIYHYNSLTDKVELNSTSIQIPEFEINDIHLLETIDLDLVNVNNIPILKQDIGDNNVETWRIGLDFYDEYTKLQSR